MTVVIGADKRVKLEQVKATFLIAQKPSKLRAMKNACDRHYAVRWEQHKASIRAEVEHPFRMIKRQFGYSCKIVSWAMAPNMPAELVCTAV